MRKQKFLEQKKNLTSTLKPSENTFEFELCVFKDSCNSNLRKHLQKEHSIIPQLDGQEEYVADITSKYEEKETQTNVLDTKSVNVIKRISDIKIEGSRLTAIRGHPRWFPCGTCRFEGRNMEGLV